MIMPSSDVPLVPHLQGLGLEYCRTLVHQGCTRLLVTSRTGELPGNVVAEFKALGCTITALQLDSADVGRVSQMMQWIREEMPYIQLYVHAAGISGLRMLQDMDTEIFMNVVHPKLIGSRGVSDASLPWESLAFFSSTSAVWSQTGAAHYAAGNAAMDTLAIQRSAEGLPGTSVQFGPFAEVGMAAGHVKELEALGLKALKSRELIDAMEVAGVVPTVVYARIDILRFKSLYTAKGPWSFLESALSRPMNTEPSIGVPKRGLSAPAVSPSAATGGSPSYTMASVQEEIRKAARDVLGEDMNDADHFPQGQLDSLSAVELSSVVGAALGMQLPATLVYDYPSVSSMADHLLGMLQPNNSGPIVVTNGSWDHLMQGRASRRTLPIAVTFAHRMPGDIRAVDAISCVPHDRWEIENSSVSFCFMSIEV